MDLYAVQNAITARKPKTQNKTQKRQQTNQKKPTKGTPGSGIATSDRDACIKSENAKEFWRQASTAEIGNAHECLYV